MPAYSEQQVRDAMSVIHWLADAGQVDEAEDRLMDLLDDLFLAEQFDLANWSLSRFDLYKFDVNLLVGLLAITVCAANRLPYRADLVTDVERRLRRLAPGRVDLLLGGLR